MEEIIKNSEKKLWEEKLEKAIAEIKEKFPEQELFENEPMCAHCSFKVGGPARVFAAPENQEDFFRLTGILKENGITPYIIGNGTNVVFPDEGTPLLFVLSTERLQNITLLSDDRIYAEAGVSLSRLAGFAYENSLTGLEFASGIPGTVGGGMMMNAGAYGGELKDAVEKAVCCRLPEQKIFEFTNGQCRFSYRNSAFQAMPGCLLLGGVFRLKKGNKEEIAAKMKELNERRRNKQPLDLPSAGSAFRRPEGYFAAALIEEAGLKGYSVGGAQISEKHAGFIVNKGGATAKDVFAVVEHVRKTVYANKGITLIPEIIFIPADYMPETVR